MLFHLHYYIANLIQRATRNYTMDAWASPTVGILGPRPNPTNPMLALFFEAREQLRSAANEPIGSPDLEEQDLTEDTPEVEPVHSLQKAPALFLAIADGDVVATEARLAENPLLITAVYPPEKQYTALMWAVVYDHLTIVESLLARDADVESTDSAGRTALVWAVHTSNLLMIEALLRQGADPEPAVTAAKLAPLEIYHYFSTHGLFSASAAAEKAEYGLALTTFDSEHLPVSPVHNLLSFPFPDSPSDDEVDLELVVDPELALIADFDYEKPVQDQYIKFTDSHIPALLDYIFSLRLNPRYQHDTRIPAAIVFQLVHYSHNKVHSADLTEFLVQCFITRLRVVTDTKSGVFNMGTGDKENPGDIVLLSYWLSVVQYLHFYFAKGQIYQRYDFLQELINLTQLLIATLAFSINLRLNLLVDDCLLNYTNLVEASKALYAKDWNLFKLQKKHPNTYDDILKMLYPPKHAELMKPSPLKYVQVLGALHYVLELHSVDLLLRVQVFSQVFYCINAMTFNRLISSSKYCSRVKAVQIRLNLSALEDWLRLHNIKATKPDVIGGLGKMLTQKLTGLIEGTETDPDLLFYYKSLYHVCKAQLRPTVELLQWLQVMTGLADEEALVNTINDFGDINYYQLVKLNKLYRYEVNEQKFPKPLAQYLKRLAAEQGEAQISRSSMHYMTQSTFLLKEVYIYLNPNHVYGVALPNMTELVSNYGSGIGGVKVLRAKKYQPLLPVSILDDVDEVLRQIEDTHDYEPAAGEASNHDYDQDEKESEGGDEPMFKGDALFKEMQPPLTLAHKNWGEDMENPW